MLRFIIVILFALLQLFYSLFYNPPLAAGDVMWQLLCRADTLAAGDVMWRLLCRADRPAAGDGG